jgi:hypothetical protein
LTDIVERAREFTAKTTIFKDGDPPMYCVLMNEMADEIERLQQHKRAQAEDIMTLGLQVGKLEAEIERLRAERNELFLANGEAASFVSSLQREIQWLYGNGGPLRSRLVLGVGDVLRGGSEER